MVSSNRQRPDGTDASRDTSDLTARLAMPSATAEAIAPASSMTAVAASSVNPPTKIASRCSNVRSVSGNSS